MSVFRVLRLVDFGTEMRCLCRPKEGAEKYELYKAAEQKKNATKFFSIHKHSEWFRRRYDPRLV